MSLLGTFLRPKSFPLSAKVTGCLQASRKETLRPGDRSKAPSRPRSGLNNTRAAARPLERCRVQDVEDIFIRALVQASSCRNGCTPRVPNAAARSGGVSEQRKQQFSCPSRRRNFSTAPHREQALVQMKKERIRSTGDQRPQVGASISREQYQDLGETYDFLPKLWKNMTRQQSPRALASPPSKHPQLAPRLVLTAEQESRPPYQKRHILPPEDEQHAQQLRQLKIILKQEARWGRNRKKTWSIYKSLRSPRPRYLSDNTMRKVLRNLTWVEFKTLEHSKQYFAVLDECVSEGVRLYSGEWNAAISFAARWAEKTSVEEVKTAVEAWMRMENFGVEADAVTFNILFDVAIRAERFALADTIYDELKARGFELNRYFRTSLIYYAGMRRDGNAVRQAFREFVNAGEIVDTAVMNCVILSLIRAGEPASAENVYIKMKELHAVKFGTLGPRTWEERKWRGKALHLTARELRREKERHEASFFGSTYSTEAKKEETQRAAPIHPDGHTFSILIRHHATTSGKYEQAIQLIQEMKANGWHVHGSVYYDMFRGFQDHGGQGHTPWNGANLEMIWNEFISAHGSPPQSLASDPNTLDVANGYTLSPPEILAKDEDSDVESELDNEALQPYFTRALSKVVLEAFYSCVGAKRMLEVWKQVQDEWPEMTAEERMIVQDTVDRRTQEDSMYLF